MPKPRLSRRQLLSASALLGSVALDGIDAKARTISGQVPWEAGKADAPTPISAGPNQFFTDDEARFIDAAVSRLIPNDELGPGAKEAGVTVFLDDQLAGPFGRAETWYTTGPWSKGTPTQGYQSRLTPAQSYRAAIKAIDAHCRQAPHGKAFAELSADEQDKLLGEMEEGKLTLEGVDAKAFFTLFLQNTREGFFADPIYGGNRDMAAWKMIGFPGARYDYREYVAKHGERFPLPPVSLHGRAAWNPKS